MFGKDDPRFLEELQSKVALDQVPEFLGGTCTEPWPYGAGGDVPRGAAKTIAAELEAVKAVGASPLQGYEGVCPAGEESIAHVAATVRASPRSSAPAMEALHVQVC